MLKCALKFNYFHLHPIYFFQPLGWHSSLEDVMWIFRNIKSLKFELELIWEGYHKIWNNTRQIWINWQDILGLLFVMTIFWTKYYKVLNLYSNLVLQKSFHIYIMKRRTDNNPLKVKRKKDLSLRKSRLQ